MTTHTTATLADTADQLAATLAGIIAATNHNPHAYHLATVAYRRATDIVIAVNTTPLPVHVYDCADALARIIDDMADYIDIAPLSHLLRTLDELLPQ